MDSLKCTMFIVLAVVSCSVNVGHAFDCNDNEFYTNRDTGDDSNEGTQGSPFETIQKLVDVLEECIDTDADADPKTGYVVATSEPYTETTRKSGLDFGGITFTKGGNSQAERIVLEGLAGAGRSRPLIDQKFLTSDDNDNPLLGIFVARDNTTSGSPRASYITIRNFEIIHATKSGIFTDRDGSDDKNNVDIVIEKNYIHHIYGEENIGGVRIDFCENCVVQNNIIHDIYNSRTDVTQNDLNNRPFGLHSGVHGYQPENCEVKNNLIYNVAKGVFQKHPDVDGDTANNVHHNIFFNNSEAAFTPQSNSVRPGINGGQFHHNVVYDSDLAVSISMQHPTQIGDDFKLFNNTIVDSASIGSVRGVENVEVYNNIFVGTNDKFSEPVIFSTNYDGTVGYGVSYIDNNLFFENSGSWVMNRNSGDEDGGVLVLDQAEWTDGSAINNIPSNRDTNSVFSTDPMFVNAQIRDYSLQPGSAALQASNARAGTTGYLGAIFTKNATTDQFEDEANLPVGPILADHKEPMQITTLTFE